METVRATLKDLLLEKWLRMRDEGKIVWETRNGKRILLKNLSDNHLDNIIAHLKEQEML